MKTISDPRSERHPCFNKAASGSYGRVHLPVAPRCNVQCNFCDRRYDCVNESRPGVTSAELKPFQALEYTRAALEREPRISVVGIAGPGDPMANPAETLETMRLIHYAYPRLVFCLSTNGLDLAAHAEALARSGVSHVTVTCNAVDPDIGAKIYAWVRDGKVIYRGRDAAELLLERQLAAVAALKRLDLIVKINTLVIPGVNDHHLRDVARKARELGADLHNLIALHPVAGTPFGALAEPDAARMRGLRDEMGAFLPQMTHCRRCRADAVGTLGCDRSGELGDVMAACASLAPECRDDRPHVAVATRDGMFVDRHLGEARRLQIWGRSEDGRFRLVETRKTPAAGGGRERWKMLAAELADCRAVLAGNMGDSPQAILRGHGIRCVPFTGGIADGLRAVYGDARTDGHIEGLTGSVAYLPTSS